MTPTLVLALAATTLASPPPPPAHRQAPILAEVSGGAAKQTVEKLEAFGTRHTLSATDSPTRGIGAARNWIKSELERYAREATPEGQTPRLTVALEEFDAPKSQRLPDGAHVVNIVATLPGEMKEAADRRYYLVGHYDSRNGEALDAVNDAPGANDNASGTAVVMECARVLASKHLDATVVFLLTAAEEQGLIGAKYHADQAAARNEHILGVLNNDIVGDPSDPYSNGSKLWMVRVFSEGLPKNPSAEALAALRATASESDSASRQLARFIDFVGSQHEGQFPMINMVFRQDRFLRGGDHIAFNEAGFAAVRFTVGREYYDRQHVNVVTVNNTREGDVARYVNGDYLGAVARLNVATVVNLASAPRPPANVRIIADKLGNNTVLRWDPSPEPDVTGYEVVYRQTTEPQWTETIDAGRATETTLRLSKDDLFFAVRAYDRDGYRSPAAFAGAAKE